MVGYRSNVHNVVCERKSIMAGGMGGVDNRSRWSRVRITGVMTKMVIAADCTFNFFKSNNGAPVSIFFWV